MLCEKGHKRTNTARFNSNEVSKAVRIIETESRNMTAKDLGGGGWE